MEDVYQRRDTLSLRDYQNKHLGFLLNNKRAMDLSDAGTGKSPTAALWVYQHTLDGRVLWVMPKALLVKNYQELLLWSNLEPHQVMLVDGTKQQREKQFSNRDVKVFLIGFTAFSNNWLELRQRYPDLVHLCGDEWHLGFSTHGEQDYRNPGKYFGPKRTHDLYQFMRKGGDLLPMTGTFLNGRLNSAYPALSLIDPLVYPSYSNFMQWHALLDEWGKPFMWKNHERLQQIIDQHSVRITYAEAYGEEKREVVVEPCTMSNKQYRAYKDIEYKNITELGEDNFLEAVNEGVAIHRCFEIMQHPEKYGLPINDLDGKEAHIETYLQTAKETGEALVIFEKVVSAHPKLVALCEKYGLTAAALNGDVSIDKGKVDYEFRNGKIKVLICSPIVAGVGFNWPHVDKVIFNSLDWQDTTFIQNYRRFLRGERETPVLIIVLFYQGGLDIKIARKIKSKSEDRTKVEGGDSLDLVSLMAAA